MILIDTSAWVEFLRGTSSPVVGVVEALAVTSFATCDVVQMELLAGARDDANLADLRGLLGRGVFHSTTPADFEFAASLYRSARLQGRTPRSLTDCVISAIAVREDLQLLTADRDFSSIAEVSSLRLWSGP